MTFARWTMASCALAFFGFSAAAQATECGPARIVAPVSETVNDSQPVIEWSPVADADYYRVRVQSKVPEGKTLMTFDTQVTGTSFRPPQPLSDYRARVYIQVTSYCSGGQGPKTESEASARFDIEPSAECRLASAPKVSVENAGVVVRWPTLVAAASYRVNLFSGADAHPVATHETRENVLKFKDTVDGVGIVFVQPRCASRWGLPSYGALSGPG